MPLGGQQCPSDQCVGLKGADLISGLAGKVRVKKQMSSPSLTATIVVPLTKETINNHSGRQIRWCLYWRGSLCECVWVLLKQTLCSLWSYPELTKVWKKICSVLGLITTHVSMLVRTLKWHLICPLGSQLLECFTVFTIFSWLCIRANKFQSKLVSLDIRRLWILSRNLLNEVCKVSILW